MKNPLLLVSDQNGNMFEIPDLLMAGMSLNIPVVPEMDELIPLPEGSDFFTLPGRAALGFDPVNKEFVEVTSYQGEPVHPVAAFMAPAHLQLYRSACRRLPGSPRLPLYSYTALGWIDGTFYVAGMRIDSDRRQDLKLMNTELIKKRARAVKKRLPKNRLVQHLVDNCVFRYGCPAARNFVMERWECPLPTSPACNSECIGCISLQPKDTQIEASQDRIRFIPSVDEILEVAVPHLKRAPRPVASFGQGCEGEPLLKGELIEQSIRQIRKKTARGVININTNGCRPDVVERLCRAGLDSIRVSLNSAQQYFFRTYFRPRDFDFAHVKETLRVAKRYKIWSSLNYFMFPGFTDHPTELQALESLILDTGINMIQTRNLNMDPDWYIDELGLGALEPEFIGMRRWVQRMNETYPQIALGYFNPPREEMRRRGFRLSR